MTLHSAISTPRAFSYCTDKPSEFPRPMTRDRTILGLDLVNTCYACPEQYDVYMADKQVGYLRLRHGWFRCDANKCGGPMIYHTNECKGDGIFTDDERDFFLQEAITALIQYLNAQTRIYQ